MKTSLYTVYTPGAINGVVSYPDYGSCVHLVLSWRLPSCQPSGLSRIRADTFPYDRLDRLNTL